MALIAEYGFNAGSDGAAGGQILDSSGNARHLTYAGGAAWEAGQFGTALARAGGSGSIAATTSITQPNTNLTIMCWFRPADLTLGTNRPIMGFSSPGGSTRYGLWAQRSDYGTPNVFQGNARVGGTLSPLTGPALTVNTWVHLAMTWSSTDWKLFINGVEVATNPTSGAVLTTGTTFEVLALADSYTAYGRVEDARVFDTALSAGEITTWMNTYVGASSTTQVTNTVQTRYNVSARVTKTEDIRYHLRSRISDVVSTRYMVRSTLTKQGMTGWGIAARTTKTSTAQWDVHTEVTKTAQSLWNVEALSSVSASAGLEWNVLTTVVKSEDVRYNVRARVTKTDDVRYRVLSMVTKTGGTRYNVIDETTKTVTIEWNVDDPEGQVSAAVGIGWHVREQAARAVSTRWHVRNRVSGAQSTRWTVRTVLSASQRVEWNIVQTFEVTATAQTRWRVIGRASATAQTRWNVLVLQDAWFYLDGDVWVRVDVLGVGSDDGTRIIPVESI